LASRGNNYEHVFASNSANGASNSANGAEYDSQGQAQSASPLVLGVVRDQGLKGRNRAPQFRPFRAGIDLLSVTRGDALRACPWLSYSAPLALFGVLFFDFETNPASNVESRDDT